MMIKLIKPDCDAGMWSSEQMDFMVSPLARRVAISAASPLV